MTYTLLSHLEQTKKPKAPQELGFHLFYTKKPKDAEVNAMQFARATAKKVRALSSKTATEIINDTFFSGPIHFNDTSFERKENHIFYDIDMSKAYTTWLLNYAKNNLGYHIGGHKEYHSKHRYWSFPHKDGMLVYRFEFAIKTNGAENSRLYRNWILKTTKVKNITITKNMIGGQINIPDVGNMPNRFLKEVQGYADYTVKLLGTIKTSGPQAVSVNYDRLADAYSESITVSNTKTIRDEWKMRMVASTGYISIMDKTMYYAMVNHVKSHVLYLMEYIEDWNKRRPKDKIDIVAANTDGITIYADKRLEPLIKSFIEYDINAYSIFTYRVKYMYTLEEANITANDIRYRKELMVNG